jgi:hypothetical protein
MGLQPSSVFKDITLSLFKVERSFIFMDFGSHEEKCWNARQGRFVPNDLVLCNADAGPSQRQSQPDGWSIAAAWDGEQIFERVPAKVRGFSFLFQGERPFPTCLFQGQRLIPIVSCNGNTHLNFIV